MATTTVASRIILLFLHPNDLLSLSHDFLISVPVQRVSIAALLGTAATVAAPGIQSCSATAPTCTVALPAQVNPARALQLPQMAGHLPPWSPSVPRPASDSLSVPSLVPAVAAQAHTHTQTSALCSCNTTASLHYTVVSALMGMQH